MFIWICAAFFAIRGKSCVVQQMPKVSFRLKNKNRLKCNALFTHSTQSFTNFLLCVSAPSSFRTLFNTSKHDCVQLTDSFESPAYKYNFYVAMVKSFRARLAPVFPWWGNLAWKAQCSLLVARYSIQILVIFSFVAYLVAGGNCIISMCVSECFRRKKNMTRRIFLILISLFYYVLRVSIRESRT